MIKRAIFTALGAVELAVDVYGWVKRLLRPREEPFPMKPKAVTPGAPRPPRPPVAPKPPAKPAAAPGPLKLR
jgi:hypothetical protein